MSDSENMAARSGEQDIDLLTRKEASAYLARFNIALKPATLARIWSVGGDGPPCQHIRRKPFYPRGDLRAWAEAQRTALRRSRHRGGGADATAR
ncbi:hypothetical protein [Phenylobacterium sp.]|uniref:hypothetical protein n=1 Tax=Phenylobacterium sp. TaxID=1871053 RepID=UPI0025DD3D6C|nr:hypothetical protein [Phenylobacterium sp.]